MGSARYGARLAPPCLARGYAHHFWRSTIMDTYTLDDFPLLLQQTFRFLVDQFGFAIVRQKAAPYGYVVEYARGQRRVILYYDYKEDFFYFTLIRGAETPYPNDQDKENIRSF